MSRTIGVAVTGCCHVNQQYLAGFGAMSSLNIVGCFDVDQTVKGIGRAASPSEAEEDDNVGNGAAQDAVSGGGILLAVDPSIL